MKFDPPKNRPEIDLDKARALGIRFCGERNARNISAQEMADHLMLSKLQIVGLETGDIKSFYSAKMYAQSADKYAKFLNFADIPSEHLFKNGASQPTAQIELSTDAAFIEAQATDSSSVESEEAISPNFTINTQVARHRISQYWIPIFFLLAAGLVTALYTLVPTETVTAAAPKVEILPPAVTSIPNPTPNPPPTPTTLAPTTETATATPTPTQSLQSPPDKNNTAATPEPAKSNAATNASAVSVATGHLLIKFTDASWVQSVDKGGNKREKIYKKGDTLDLEPNNLQALVIGNAGAVAINNSKAEISLKPYIASGSQVARIIGPDIRKLGN